MADVGQGDVEEINLVESGGNYGWRIKEGEFDFDDYLHPNTDTATLPGSENLIKVGLSVTGGVVYRGSDFPELQGKYLFADWSSGFGQPNGTLLGLEETSPDVFDLSVLEVVGGNPFPEFIQAFGLDEAGEVYVGTKGTLAPSSLNANGLPSGTIYRVTVVPEPSAWVLSSVGALLIGWWRGGRQALSGNR